jgi:hypothetical protein
LVLRNYPYCATVKRLSPVKRATLGIEIDGTKRIYQQSFKTKQLSAALSHVASDESLAGSSAARGRLLPFEQI